MNKQSMAQKQPQAEQPGQPMQRQAPQQPATSADAAAMQAAQQARLRARQSAIAKAGGQTVKAQGAQRQTAQTTKPEMQTASPAQTSANMMQAATSAVQTPAGTVQASAGAMQPAAGVAHPPVDALQSPASAGQAASRQAAQEAVHNAAHPTKPSVNASTSHAAPSQGRRTGMAQKQTEHKRTHLPGMPMADDDTEISSQTPPHANVPKQKGEAALPRNKKDAPPSGRRQAVLQEDDGEDEDTPKKRAERSRKSAGKRKESAISKLAILALVTFAVFLICGIAVFFQLDQFLFGKFEDVEMPNFDGKNVSEIQFNEEYKSFNIKYEDVYTDEEAIGVVVQQNPRAPRRVKENATVTLYISAGARTVEVPSLTRVTRDEAKKMLEEVGLNPIFKPVTDATAVPDTILHTDPAAGTSINYGETVQVYFTRSEDATKIKVPQCVGLATMSEAIRMLATEGLNYELSAESVGDGMITAQLPEAGEMVPRGTKILLTVNGSAATGLDTLPQMQITGADGHTHEYAPTSVVPSNEYSIGYTIYTCSVCNYFYYGDFTQPSAG